MREMSKEGLGLKDPTDKLSGGTQVSALQGHLPNWPRDLPLEQAFGAICWLLFMHLG